MVKLKELLKEDLITERKLRDYDTSEMNELLKRLNKLTADIKCALFTDPSPTLT